MNIIKTTLLLILMAISLGVNAGQTSFLDDLFETEESIEMRAAHRWVMQSKCKVSQKEAHILVKEVYKTSAQKKLDPKLVLGLIKYESCFNRNAVSKSGAIGYTQVLPVWHQDKIKGRNLNKTSVNVDVGTSILKEYLRGTKGNVRKALVKYSGNSTNYYNKVLHNLIELENSIVMFRTGLKFKNVNVLVTDIKKQIDSISHVIFSKNYRLLTNTTLILTKTLSTSVELISPYHRYKDRPTLSSVIPSVYQIKT